MWSEKNLSVGHMCRCGLMQTAESAGSFLLIPFLEEALSANATFYVMTLLAGTYFFQSVTCAVTGHALPGFRGHYFLHCLKKGEYRRQTRLLLFQSHRCRTGVYESFLGFDDVVYRSPLVGDCFPQ